MIDNNNDPVTIAVNDHQQVGTIRQVAKLFKQIGSEADTESEFQVTNVSLAMLGKAVFFAEQNILNPQPDIPLETPKCNQNETFVQWVKDFYEDMSRDDWVDLYQASLYLKYKDLRDITRAQAYSQGLLDDDLREGLPPGDEFMAFMF